MAQPGEPWGTHPPPEYRQRGDRVDAFMLQWFVRKEAIALALKGVKLPDSIRNHEDGGGFK